MEEKNNQSSDFAARTFLDIQILSFVPSNTFR